MRNFQHTLIASIAPLVLAGLAPFAVVARTAPPAPPANPPIGSPVPPPPANPVTAVQETVVGAVDSFNLDPRGQANSVVLKTENGRLAQFNFPPHLGPVVERLAAVGQHLTATGTADLATGDRKIYRLTSLKGPDDKSSLVVPLPGMPESIGHVNGTVKTLNIGSRGEVDGARLDNGDYVHTGPQSAATLKPGFQLSVDGTAVPMADGNQAFEAVSINNQPVIRPAPPRDRLAPPAPPAPGRSPIPPVPGVEATPAPAAPPTPPAVPAPPAPPAG